MIFLAEAFTRRAMMRGARQARLQPVLHVLHVEELALGARRVRRRAGSARCSASTSGRTSSPTRRTSSTSTSARRPAGVRGAARARRDAEPDLRHLLGLRALRERAGARRAARSTSTPRSTRLKERALDGPLLPLDPARQRDPAREPGAAAPRATSRSSTPQNDALIAYAKRHRATRSSCVVNLDPHNAQEGVVDVPAHLGLPPPFAVARPARRRALRLAPRRATTSGSSRRARRRHVLPAIRARP